MNSINGSLHQPGSRVLWIPFLLMAISAILGLVYLIFIVISYTIDFQFSQGFNFLMGAIYYLTLPLFVFGAALLLMQQTNVKKATAGWSRLTFFVGAILLIYGGFIGILQIWWWMFESFDGIPDGSLDVVFTSGNIATYLANALCIVATLFLVRSYLKGEVSTKPNETLT